MPDAVASPAEPSGATTTFSAGGGDAAHADINAEATKKPTARRRKGEKEEDLVFLFILLVSHYFVIDAEFIADKIYCGHCNLAAGFAGAACVCPNV